MSQSARSLFVFALYLFGMGAALLLAPNFLLSALGLAETQDVWIRVLGMVVLILGYYYAVAARNELLPILRASVIGRGSVILFFAAFVVLGLAPPLLLALGAVDLVAAIWTGLCLRSESR